MKKHATVNKGTHTSYWYVIDYVESLTRLIIYDHIKAIGDILKMKGMSVSIPASSTNGVH